ncbi:MAG: LysR substrate-binding domain-containing protein, partial [Myxococcota bacterium]
LEPDDALALSLERRWLAHHVPNRRTVLRASSSATLAQAAAAGLGVALLSVPLAHRLGPIPQLGPPVAAHELWLVVHRDSQRVRRVTAVADWLAGCVAEVAEVAEPVDPPGPRPTGTG